MSDAFNPLSVVGDFIGGAFSYFNGKKQRESAERMNAQNIAFQKEANAQNIALQRELNQTNLDYAMSEAKIMREREDTAHQREVDDLKKAGLSPLASLNGASASSSALPSLSAPSVVAPQVDASGVVDSYRLQTEGVLNALNSSTETLRQSKKLSVEKEISQNSLDNALNIANINAKNAKDMNDKNISQRESEFARNLEHLKASLAISRETSDRELALSAYKTEIECANKMFGGISIRDYDSEEDYQRALNEFNDALVTLNKKINDLNKSYSSSDNMSETHGENWNAGASVGYGSEKKSTSILGDVISKVAPSFDASGNIGEGSIHSGSSGKSYSRDFTKAYDALLTEFKSSHHFPVRSFNLIYSSRFKR